MTRLALPLITVLAACGAQNPSGPDVSPSQVESTPLGRLEIPHEGIDPERTYMLASEGSFGALVVTADERLEYRLLDGTVVSGPSIEGYNQGMRGISSVEDAGVVIVDFGETSPDAKAWRVSPRGFEAVEGWPSDVGSHFGSVVGDAAFMDASFRAVTRVDLLTGATTRIPTPEGVSLGLVSGGHGRFLSTDRDVFHVLDIDSGTWSTHAFPEGLRGGYSAFDGPDHVVIDLMDPDTREHVLARVAVDGSTAQVSTERWDELHRLPPCRGTRGGAVRPEPPRQDGPRGRADDVPLTAARGIAVERTSSPSQGF